MEREALASVLDELAENIHGLLGNRLDKIVLYGSYARGDNSGESDVDILVLTDLSAEENRKLRREVNRVFSRIGLKHDVLLSMFLIDKKAYEEWMAVTPFYQNIEKAVFRFTPFEQPAATLKMVKCLKKKVGWMHLAMDSRQTPSVTLLCMQKAIQCSQRFKMVTFVSLNGTRVVAVMVRLYSQSVARKTLTMEVCTPSRNIRAKSWLQKKAGSTPRWS